MFGRVVEPPATIVFALEHIFNEPIAHVRVIENSVYARMHVGARATTRRARILLAGDAETFWRDPELMLHEYFHVLRQWQTHELTIVRYVIESMRCGYWRNHYEIEARIFAARHSAALRRALRGQIHADS